MRLLHPLILLLLFPVGALAQNPEAPPKGPPAAPVVTAAVEKGMLRPPLTLVGTAEPRYRAEVAAEQDGAVEAFSGRKGEKVKKGATIVRLRTKPLALTLEEARGRVREIEARLQKARDDARRAESLFSQNFISEQEMQSFTTDVTALLRQKEQAEAEVRLVKDRLTRLEVKAPFSGRIIEERTEVGQWVNAGTPVAVLADLSVMHVMVPVPEQEVAAIRPGDTVEVRVDALPSEAFSGIIRAVVPQADRATRTFPVQISVENPKGRILSGMLVRITFRPGKGVPALLVPKDALVLDPEGDGGKVVRVENGKAQMVTVKVQGSEGTRYAVEPVQGRLAPGDKVVIRGNERLRPGQPVRETPEGN